MLEIRKWVPWQLADDEKTYGSKAGMYIIVSEDGQEEFGKGLFETYEECVEAISKVGILGTPTWED